MPIGRFSGSKVVIGEDRSTRPVEDVSKVGIDGGQRAYTTCANLDINGEKFEAM